MRLSWHLGLALALFAGVTTSAQAQMRFQGMDTNHDGVITRSEWRGNERSFRNQDWNGDGVLSGDEVREGARRQDGNQNQDWNRDGRIDNVDQEIAQRFRGYDMNNDARVAANEWPGDRRLFERLDTNGDHYLTMQEYITGGGFRLDSIGGPTYGFSSLDSNRDGWITRNEWNIGAGDFNRLDINRDNRISRFEFEAETANNQGSRYSASYFGSVDADRDGWITRSEWRDTAAAFDRLDTNQDNRISRFEFETGDSYNDNPSSNYDRFAVVDQNHDGWLTRSEWRGTEAVFTRLDTNRDNRLSRSEYNAETTEAPGSSSPGAHSAAWRMGYDRGIQEGHAAGREDYVRGQGWDLNGQRELERADSGYRPQIGSLTDYQAGYREGFRNAYRAGFLEARDNKK